MRSHIQPNLENVVDNSTAWNGQDCWQEDKYLVLVHWKDALEGVWKQLAEGCDNKGLWIQRGWQISLQRMLLRHIRHLLEKAASM